MSNLQHIYGRSVVVLYKPTYDEKRKRRLLEIFTHFNVLLYDEGLLKWPCFAAILLHSNSCFFVHAVTTVDRMCRRLANCRVNVSLFRLLTSSVCVRQVVDRVAGASYHQRAMQLVDSLILTQDTDDQVKRKSFLPRDAMHPRY